jgi:predicted  nucleic acid-binding Zn-ribbon protein
LALDLLRDREKNISDRLDRLSLEQEEIRNEIKLQGKMQDFLGDIQRMNEDSSFPRGSLRRNDLQSYMGKNSRNSLEGRLAELGREILKGRQSLVRINSAITRLEGAVGENRGGRP